MTPSFFRSVRTAAASVVLVAVAALSSGGCGNATANTALALLGVGAGAQALTGTNAQVTVDVYDPGEEEFRLGHPLAIQRLTGSAPVSTADPVNNPRAAELRQIAAKIAPVMERMQGATAQLRSHAETLKKAGADFDDVGVAFEELARKQDEVTSAWTAYRAALSRVKGSRSKTALRTAARRLLRLREALEALSRHQLPAVAMAFLRTDINSAALAALKNREPDELRRFSIDLSAALKQASAAADPLRGASGQIQALAEAARRALASEPEAALAAAAAAESAGVFVIDPLEAAARVAAAAPAERAEVATELALGATKSLQSDAELARAMTFGLLTSTPNIGPISNEVTQVLLTPGKTLAAIADPSELNQKRWKRFSHATVRGGPGNNDVIFYMENASMPVLKSAAFDPTKFIVANGKLYQRAFSILADGIIDAEADADDSGTNPNTDSDTNTDTNTDTGTDSDTNTNPDTDADPDADPDPGANPDPVTNPTTNPDADADADTEVDAEAEADEDVDPDAAPDDTPDAPDDIPDDTPDDTAPGDETGAADDAAAKIAAVRTAKLEALRAVLDADKAVAGKIKDANWTSPEEGKAAVRAAKSALWDAAAKLRDAAK